MNFKIRSVANNDMPSIIHLLKNYQLPTIDIEDDSVQLFVGMDNDEVIGTIGIERYGSTGLLRSLAVKGEFKNKEIGKKLVQYLLEFCKAEQITELYLLTTTAANYFSRMDFRPIERSQVPETIMHTREFKDICPKTAVVMYKK